MSESLCVVGSWFGKWRAGRRLWLWLLSELSLFLFAGSAGEHPGRFTNSCHCFQAALVPFSNVLFCSFTACGHCYVINTGALVGAIIADIILTVLITVFVFCFVMQYKRQRDPDSELCLPLPHELVLFHTHVDICLYV